MTKEELTKILELHNKWLNNEEGGKCADLRCVNLSHIDLSNAILDNVDLSNANLSNAILDNVDLSNANLINANLNNADLNNVNLSNAKLSYANLNNADLNNVDLSYAILSNAHLNNANLNNADLSNVDLNYADLINADLSNVDLSYAILSSADLDEKEQCRKGIILKKKLIAYKKLKNNIIATLEIPKGAIVFSINNSKCRTNKVKCIALSDNAEIGYSTYDIDFTYEINKKYEIEDFDLMYNVECASGIHFFKTIEEAENYYE